MTPPTKPRATEGRIVLAVACLLVLATYGLMIDLKGISTDEGIRLGIINGGQPFLPAGPGQPGWAQVLQTNSPYAYQPLYFLIQNTLMRVTGSQHVLLFRSVNLFFLWVSLQGLLALSKGWRLPPRLFLITVFSFNAYLLMHVLQIREYILGVAFYIWSTWLVLRLDGRKLARAWADVAWFAAYGVLLILGFYVQSWVVFPAIAQFLFLMVRRTGARGRFYAHLALSYLIVLSFTWPYLHTHQQKVNIGRWGVETSALWPQLSDGFHLVLTGHLAGHSLFTEFLFWFWLVVIAGAALLLFRKPFHPAAEVDHREFKREGLLMLLCMAVSLVFQIGYFLRVDTLSVWPRYFVIHYFFLFWLLALAFKYLGDLRAAGAGSAGTRRGLTAAVGVIAAVAIASGIYQTISYYQFPLLDTGFSRESNWRTLAAGLSRVVAPGDVVVTYDFINRSTLTFTRPMSNRVILLPELETSGLQSADRLVYLEPVSAQPQRSDLVARMTAMGFKTMQETSLPTSDGKEIISDWRVLTFNRR